MATDAHNNDRKENATALGRGLGGAVEKQYMATLANQNADILTEKLDALTGAINQAADSSSDLGRRMKCLTWALVVATAVGAVATIFIAIVALKQAGW